VSRKRIENVLHWVSCSAVSILVAIAQQPTQALRSPARVALSGVAAITRVDIETAKATNGRVPFAIQIHNISPKTIYAYALTGTATYADGSVRSIGPNSSDLIALYVNESLVPRWMTLELEKQHKKLPELLRSGESYTSALYAPLGADGAAPISAEAAVTMVTFEDRTALGDSNEIRKIATSRKERTLAVAGLLEDLRIVIGADDPALAGEARLREVAAGRAMSPDGQPLSAVIIEDVSGRKIESDMRRTRANLLQGALVGTNGDRTRIASRIADNEQHLRVLREQSILLEVTK
jgi:hypothetical protein